MWVRAHVSPEQPREVIVIPVQSQEPGRFMLISLNF